MGRGTLYLASGSPRRRMLLELCGFQVEVVVPMLEEVWPGGHPEQAVITLARQKLEASRDTRGCYLAADTIVCCDDEVLGKPTDSLEAVRMLRLLAGRTHSVWTGVAVSHGLGPIQTTAVCSSVTFRELEDHELETYVEAGESLDKAGAYGIQGAGGCLVKTVEGSYSNVIGLPVEESLRVIDFVI
ncbi:MAG: Maf family protein [Myxococcota bacterium]|nr:Maf family protein [Myxococcota bacterium]